MLVGLFSISFLCGDDIDVEDDDIHGEDEKNVKPVSLPSWLSNTRQFKFQEGKNWLYIHPCLFR